MTRRERGPIGRALGRARTRILASTIVLLAASALVSAAAIEQLLNARTNQRVERALRAEYAEFAQLARTCVDPDTGDPCATLARVFDVYAARNAPGAGETIATFLGGRLHNTLSSGVGGRADFAAAAPRWARATRSESGVVHTRGGELQYLVVPIRRGTRTEGTFAVAVALSAQRRDARDAVVVVIAVLGGVLLVASALAWLIAGRVLAPLRLLADTARSISESDLTRRIPVSGDDELADLAHTFNAMLDRVEAAFASQRAFVNDASHELRTPITIVRGHLELLGDDPQERRETIALVTDELDRMSRFVDDLLLLARADRTDFLRLAGVELGPLADELLAKAQALAPRDWRLEARAEGLIDADRQRVTQAIMGLAQNATQHTEDGAPIALGSAIADGEARLWVRDEGPGIAEADQARVFERFARAGDGRRRSEGAGLGLAIVRAIAEAHGGRVDLDSRPGAGATFTVVLPIRHPVGR